MPPTNTAATRAANAIAEDRRRPVLPAMRASEEQTVIGGVHHEQKMDDKSGGVDHIDVGQHRAAVASRQLKAAGLKGLFKDLKMSVLSVRADEVELINPACV